MLEGPASSFLVKSGLDSLLKTKGRVLFIDWNTKDCLADKDLFSETKVGLQSDSYTNGFNNISSWYCYANGDMSSMEK